MSDKPLRRRRHRQRQVHSVVPVVRGDQDLEGTRYAYQALAARMELVSWSVDDVFPEREQQLWDELATLASQRGLPVAQSQPQAAAKPILSRYRVGARKQYRELAARLRSLTDHPTADFLASERTVWDAIWMLGAERGVITLPETCP